MVGAEIDPLKLLASSSPFFKAMEGLFVFEQPKSIKKLRCIIANLHIRATINYQKISKKSIGMVEFVIPKEFEKIQFPVPCLAIFIFLHDVKSCMSVSNVLIMD